MKKIISLLLVTLLAFSMIASAATLSSGVITSAAGNVVATAGAGFKIALTKVDGTTDMYKARLSFVGTVNKALDANCALVYDKTKVVLIDAATIASTKTELTVNFTNGASTPVTWATPLAGVTAITAGGLWNTKNAKYQPTATRAYISLGVDILDRVNGTAITIPSGDWYDIYFKVKDGSTITNSNVASYFWVPATSGPELSKITMKDGAESITLTTPAGTDTTTAFKSLQFQKIIPDLDVVIVDNKITASIGANGIVAINGAKVANGGEVNLATATTATIEVMPNMGYEVATATLGGVSMGIAKDGGKFDATGITGTKALVVTFAARTEVAKPQAHKKVFEEAAVTFPGAPSAKPAVTTFASKPSVGVVSEYGIKLTKGGVDVTIPGPVGDTGPMFKSKTATSASGQYGIQFIGLPAGTYEATPYAIVDGTPVFGTPVTFVK